MLRNDIEEAMTEINEKLKDFVPKKRGSPMKLERLVTGLDEDGAAAEDEDWCREEDGGSGSNIPPVTSFTAAGAGPLIAVDCGCKRLGETEDGLVIALRAAIVVDDRMGTHAKLYRTGPLYLSNRHKAEILHSIGKRLGAPDYYVYLDDTDPLRAAATKRGVADKAVQYTDRFRAFLEKLVQGIAVAEIKNGTVFFDGSLTLRTRDCPDPYLNGLAKTASSHGNAIVAISKTSDLLVNGKAIRFWLDDTSGPCYREMTPLLREEKGFRARGWGERVMGNVYSVRFSTHGPTFRTDVKPPRGGTDREALDQCYASAHMRGGYPEILVRAHALSYFSSEAVMHLQSAACAEYGFRPRPDVSLSATFAPFGGRFK